MLVKFSEISVCCKFCEPFYIFISSNFKTSMLSCQIHSPQHHISSPLDRALPCRISAENTTYHCLEKCKAHKTLEIQNRYMACGVPSKTRQIIYMIANWQVYGVLPKIVKQPSWKQICSASHFQLHLV
jgi:hypothetical protein